MCIFLFEHNYGILMILNLPFKKSFFFFKASIYIFS